MFFSLSVTTVSMPSVSPKTLARKTFLPTISSRWTATPSCRCTRKSTLTIRLWTRPLHLWDTSPQKWMLPDLTRSLRSGTSRRRKPSCSPTTDSARAAYTRSFCGPTPRREGLSPLILEPNDKGCPLRCRRDSTLSSHPVLSAGLLKQVGGA